MSLTRSLIFRPVLFPLKVWNLMSIMSLLLLFTSLRIVKKVNKGPPSKIRCRVPPNWCCVVSTEQHNSLSYPLTPRIS